MILQLKNNKGTCIYVHGKECGCPLARNRKCRKIGCQHFKRKEATYYLTLSQAFPKTHARVGEPTNFEAAFNNAQMCAKCRERSTGMCMNECVIGYLKRHTIRANYDFWAKRFEKIAAGEAVLSIRQWVGKPYGKGSTQREIALLTREDGIGLQRLEFSRKEGTARFVDGILRPFVDGVRLHNTQMLANNDGLSMEDWQEWFIGYDLSRPMAIIHFTKFRY